MQSFVQSAAADAARFIGDETGTGKALGELGSAGHVLAHAALGCAAAALSGRDCASGALGAATSAWVGSLLPDPQTLGERALMAGALGFAGGAVAQGAGRDGGTAVSAASNEVLNNRLLHIDEIRLIKSRAKDFAKRLNGDKEPTPQQVAQAETRLLDQADRNVNQHSDLRLDGEANRFLTDLKRELVRAGQDGLPGGGQYFFASPEQYFNDRMYAETLNTAAGQQVYRQIQAGQTGPYLPGYYYKQGIADANREATRQAVAGAVTAGAILAPLAASACLTNPVACNQIGITTAELLSEGGVVAGGVMLGGKAGAKGETEIVQRWMSKAELEATQQTGLLRGGRDGMHYVTDAANTDPLRARQRLALPKTPEVRVTLEVPKGVFSQPSRVEPAFNMPGGGMERTATGKIPVQILEVR